MVWLFIERVSLFGKRKNFRRAVFIVSVTFFTIRSLLSRMADAEAEFHSHSRPITNLMHEIFLAAGGKPLNCMTIV